MEKELEYFDIESTLDPWPPVEYTEEELESYELLRERLQELTKDKKIVVFGAGGQIGAKFYEKFHNGTPIDTKGVVGHLADMEISFAPQATSTAQREFPDWHMVKARRGKGHDKFKKRKKK